MEVVKLGIKNGANEFDLCLESDNREVVKLGIEYGANKLGII